MMCQKFLTGERFRRQVSPVLGLWWCCQRCGWASSCWNMQGLPWKRHCLDGKMCCSESWIYLSVFLVAFLDLQAASSLETNAPPYHWRQEIWNWTLITSQMVLLLFSLEEAASVISKKNLKVWAVKPKKNSFQLRFSSFYMMFTHGFFFFFTL